jgi:hypothetical protein
MDTKCIQRIGLSQMKLENFWLAKTHNCILGRADAENDAPQAGGMIVTVKAFSASN